MIQGGVDFLHENHPVHLIYLKMKRTLMTGNLKENLKKKMRILGMMTSLMAKKKKKSTVDTLPDKMRKKKNTLLEK